MGTRMTPWVSDSGSVESIIEAKLVEMSAETISQCFNVGAISHSGRKIRFECRDSSQISENLCNWSDQEVLTF